MLLLGLAGTGVCLTLLIRFLLLIINNGLPWNPSDGVREHYRSKPKARKADPEALEVAGVLDAVPSQPTFVAKLRV